MIQLKESRGLEYLWQFRVHSSFSLNLTFHDVYFFANTDSCYLGYISLRIKKYYELLFCGKHSNMPVYSHSNEVILLLHTVREVFYKIHFLHQVMDKNCVVSINSLKLCQSNLCQICIFHKLKFY